MKTEILELNNNYKIYEYLLESYKKNKIVAIPTETVYGLSADATNFEAVRKIFLAKGRPNDNPLIVHFYEISQLEKIVNLNADNVKKLIKNFWPGPLTIILPIINKGIIADNVTAGLDTLAIRMPSNYYARKILKETNLLLAAPSANTSGKPSPTKYEHVYNDLNNKVDIILKGDDSEIGLESTVIDCTRFPFKILRPGSISKNDIERKLGSGFVEYYNNNSESIKPISPGMKYRHYAPNADLIVVDDNLNNFIKYLSNKNDSCGVITYTKYEDKFKNLKIIKKFLAYDENDINKANKNFYNILREFDKLNVKKIYFLSIEENDKNKALLSRLKKASSKI